MRALFHPLVFNSVFDIAMKNSLFLLLLICLATGPLVAQPPTTITASSDWVFPKKQAVTVPVITWKIPQTEQVTQYRLTTSVTVHVQSGDAATQVQFFANGKELNRQMRGFKRVNNGAEFSDVILLVAGRNEIQVKATNAAGSTTSELRVIICQPENAPPAIASKGVQGQKRLALIVANGNYKQYKLMNPSNDGRAVKQQLETLGFEVIFKENLSRPEFTQTLDAFMEALGTHNVGLFYYAGHGLMVSGETFVQPIDAEPKTEPDVSYVCYPLRQIVEKMAYANPKGANLVFWDACRNNPYRSWRRGAGERMFPPVNPAVGTMIVYATEPGKQAYDGDQENGLFTSELVKHISQPDVDVIELVNRIDQGLEDRGFVQPPYYEGRLKGRFVFNIN